MILRILFFAALGWMLVLWARGRSRRAAVEPPHAQQRDDGQSVPMKVCAHCGILLPEPEALRAGGRHYCCPEHRQAGPVQ